jgi:hypothetical protein
MPESAGDSTAMNERNFCQFTAAMVVRRIGTKTKQRKENHEK